MKVCIPVTGPDGLQAFLQPDFNAADHLLVFDLQTGEHRSISRSGNEDQGGNASDEQIAVDALLTAGMDRASVRAFAAQGIQVFTTKAETVAQALQSFEAGEIEELIAGECCGGLGQGREKSSGCGGKGHSHANGKHGACSGSKGCAHYE